MSKIFEVLNLGDKPLHTLFKKIVNGANYTTPSQLINDCWSEYEKRAESKSTDSSKNRNGQFLELKQYTIVEAGSIEIVTGNLIKQGK